MKALDVNGREIHTGDSARLAMSGYSLPVKISQVQHQREGTLITTVSGGLFRMPRSLFAKRTDEIAAFERIELRFGEKQERSEP